VGGPEEAVEFPVGDLVADLLALDDGVAEVEAEPDAGVDDLGRGRERSRDSGAFKLLRNLRIARCARRNVMPRTSPDAIQAKGYASAAMRLYHVPNSSSQRVVWLLEELGEPYELVILGDRPSRLADREHMGRHPMGRVPVLEDDGGPVFESGAICLYLADKYPKAGLLGAAGTHERGLAYQWSFFAYTELQARVLQIRLAGSAEAADAPTKSLAEAVAAVDRALQGKDFLVGDRFSVADLLVGTALRAARRLGAVELPVRVGRYLDMLESRPAKQRADAQNPPPASAA